MQTIKTYSLEEVLPFIHDNPSEKTYINFDGYDVNVNSQRLILFKRNRICVCCGLVGCKFILRLDKPLKDGVTTGVHMDLFFESNGRNILMTRDHIIPLSGGGKDVLENQQVMCTICNLLKGKAQMDMENLRELQKQFTLVQNEIFKFNEMSSKLGCSAKFKAINVFG